jgi:SHS2 domain-containing protein
VPYRYLEDLAPADAAFKAWGETLEEMLLSASDATLNIMAGDLQAIRPRNYRQFRLEEAEIDMLLFQLLQELIYYKDAEQLLLRVRSVQMQRSDSCWRALVEAAGETIDPERHDLIVDIKAVTLYRLQVRQIPNGWEATVVVDV